MQGEIVICDRFIDATIAYQGYGRALSTSLIHTLNQTVTKNLKPNLTFLLDIEPEQGLRNALKKHKDSRGDRLEREEIDFYRRVREGYLEISRFEPERIKVISVNRSIAEVHSIIRKYVDELLEETFGCLYIEQRE
jgi:dTMP kinase